MSQDGQAKDDLMKKADEEERKELERQQQQAEKRLREIAFRFNIDLDMSELTG